MSKKEAPKIVIEEEEEEEDPILGLKNNTPAMLKLKCRSIAAGRSKIPVKAAALKTRQSPSIPDNPCQISRCQTRAQEEGPTAGPRLPRRQVQNGGWVT